MLPEYGHGGDGFCGRKKERRDSEYPWVQEVLRWQCRMGSGKIAVFPLSPPLSRLVLIPARAIEPDAQAEN